MVDFRDALMGMAIPVLVALGAIAVILVVITVIRLLLNRRRYYKSEYARTTGRTWSIVRNNDGARGEYLLSCELEKIPGYHRLIFNCYVPTDKQQTSEIDVCLINATGIFVFEMKNYSGWIFGSQDDYQWTQVFPNMHKERFYNPLRQNSTHLRWLQKYLMDVGPLNYYPIVVFGRGCTLKKLSVDGTASVVTLDQVRSAVQAVHPSSTLSDNQIDFLFERLYPLSQVSEETKAAHVASINARR